MPKIIIKDKNIEIEGESGVPVCDQLIMNGVEIEHACEMSGACTTCHIIVEVGYDSMEEPDDNEDEKLDMAWGVTPKSRLSCQSVLGSQDITIIIPKNTINLAKEEE